MRRGGRPFDTVSALQFGGGIQSIDLSTWGTFTRSTTGTYLTGAPTDGSTAFIASASANVRRIENRGDFDGLLIEGSRTNYIVLSRNMVGGGWSSGSQSVTSLYGPGCDGAASTSTRQYFTAPGGGYSQYQNVGPRGTAWFTGSGWARATTGTQSVRLVNAWGSTAGTFAESRDDSTTTTYRRLVAPLYYSTGAGPNLVPLDARDYSGSGGTGSITASDAEFDFLQLEDGSFSSSAIVTTTATVTRGSDILTGSVSQAPGYMLNGRWTFDVAPAFSHTQGINHATDQCLFSFAEDDSERIFFVVSGGSFYIRVSSGGATKVTSNALTFSAHQKLTVIVDGSAGSISVSGATTGNGTVTGSAWTRTVGSTLYVGNRQGATQPVFARIGRTINAA